MILIDDGQTVKKLLNHEDSAKLALSYSDCPGGPRVGWRRLPASSLRGLRDVHHGDQVA